MILEERFFSQKTRNVSRLRQNGTTKSQHAGLDDDDLRTDEALLRQGKKMAWWRIETSCCLVQGMAQVVYSEPEDWAIGPYRRS